MNKNTKRIINFIGIFLTVFIVVGCQIIYVYLYVTEGDREMMNIRYQQKTFLSSLVIVFAIVDIVLLIGGLYYIKNKLTMLKMHIQGKNESNNRRIK